MLRKSRSREVQELLGGLPGFSLLTATLLVLVFRIILVITPAGPNPHGFNVLLRENPVTYCSDKHTTVIEVLSRDTVLLNDNPIPVSEVGHRLQVLFGTESEPFVIPSESRVCVIGKADLEFRDAARAIDAVYGEAFNPKLVLATKEHLRPKH